MMIAKCGQFKRRRKRIASGLSLMEVIASTLIVGGMIVAALESVGAVYRAERTNAYLQVGPGLAHELMGEILAQPYEDPEDGGGPIGTETGESSTSRDQFDDVDDYNGWIETDAEDRSGTALDGYTGWQRDVAVSWADPADGSVELISDTGLKRVTVTVTDPDGIPTQLVALRWKDGALEQSPAVDTLVVTWIGAELEIGHSPVIVRHGTKLINHASDSN